MSTIQITAADAVSLERTDGKRAGFLSRLIHGMTRNREMQARRYVRAHLKRLPETRLKDLGFTDAEIAEIRSSPYVPVAYWI